MNMRSVWTAVVIIGLAGCGYSGDGPGQDTSTDGDVPGRGTVTIEGDDPIVLRFREAIGVTGKYEDVGGSGAATDIELSFQGQAQDSTLSATSVRSADDGTFAFTVTAGTLDAEFSIRVVAADGAEDSAGVRVEVGSASMTLAGDYTGRRAIDAYRVVVTDGDVDICPSLTGEVVQDLGVDALPASVSHLPEDLLLAVALSGSWCDGECTAWVHGCLEDVTLDADAPLDRTVSLADDLTYFAAPSFGVHAEIDAGTPAGTWADALLEPIGALHATSDDPARFIIDGIYDKIVTELGVSEGDLFAGARYADSLDAQVNAALGDTGLPADTATIRAALVTLMDPLVIEGSLVGVFWSGEVLAVLTLERMGSGTSFADASLMLEAVPAEAEVEVAYVDDLVALGEHMMPAGLGESLIGLAEQIVLPGMMGETSAVTLEDFLEWKLDCDVVAGVLETVVIEGTDHEWYRNACIEVVDGVAVDAMGEASLLDGTHPGLVLEAGCDFLDAGYPRDGLACDGTVTSVSWGGEALAGGAYRLDPP